MKQRVLLIALLATAACSGLDTLTPGLLKEAEEKWNVTRPVSYRIVIDMSGDRVEAGRFEATIRDEKVVSLRRNGSVISPDRGQDYSMEGLFQMLRQEMGLAEKPSMLGAPAGYSVYMQARFDEVNGRLIRYSRSVGGASNAVEIDVVEYGAN